LARLDEEGDEVVVHGLRGQPSNRRIRAAIQVKAVKVLEQPEWHRFGPMFDSKHE